MARRDAETNRAAFLGDELRRARLAAGFSSQDALAGKLGFDRTVVTKAETGERPRTPEALAAWRAAWPVTCSAGSACSPGGLTGRCRPGSMTGCKPRARPNPYGYGHRCWYRACCKPQSTHGRCSWRRRRTRPTMPYGYALGARLDRRCQHMPVPRVGKLQSLDQRLIPGHQAVPDRGVHQIAQTTEPRRRDIWPVPTQRGDHLIQDLVRPLCLNMPDCAILISRSRNVFG